ELAVLATRPQGPAHRVDDPLQWLPHLPDLLDAERPRLRVLAAQPEAVECSPGQMSLRPLRQDRDAREDVGARLEVAELLPTPPAPSVAGAHAEDAPAVDEQLLRRRLREDRRTEALGLLGEEPPELRQ